ncbi:MAG TPA: xanthine dehydrogenase family protein subunit M [Vicinamibacterales bacterium]|nr:xanthine dehydrogenase family protein subunit M [Vicinamibacterales bacterium]
MRSFLPHYSLVAPSSLPEVLALLGMSPPRRPFAGGTDLMVLLEAGTLPEGGYVGLWHLQELRGIKDSGEAIEIGALTTYTEIASHPLLQADWPLLCRAAEETGGVATQNRGTIGGNIANASPAADTPPALIAYDAELEIVSTRGTRRVPYDRFHTGYKQMDLGADELIARIHLPKRPGSWRQYYRKVGTRRAQAIAKVCMAVACDINADGVVDDIRIALGSVSPTVVRARAAEAALRGHGLTDATITAAEAALEREIAPIDDIRSTARYRLRVARALLREALRL